MRKFLSLLATFIVAVSMSVQAQGVNKMEVKCDSTVGTHQIVGGSTGKQKEEYTYDAQGNQTSDSFSDWTDGAWVYSNLYEKTYDAQGNMTSMSYCTWKDGVWVYSSKVECIYDAQGIKTSQITSKWTDGAWVNSSKNEYTYDDQGNMTLQISSKWTDGAWVNSSKNEYTYDAQGNQTLYITSKWTDGAWVNSFKYEYTYDAQGNKISEIRSNWTGGAWVNSFKYEYTYDAQGNEISAIRSNWTEGEWVNYQKHEYCYDAQGNQTLLISSKWENDIWNLTYKDEYTYDAQGKSTLSIKYEWQNDTWVELYRFTYENYYTGHLYAAVPEEGISTVYADKNLIVPDGAEVYGLEYIAGGNYFDYTNAAPYAAGTVLPANMGFILKSGQANLDFVVKEQAPEAKYGNMLTDAAAITSCLSGVTTETATSTISGTIYTYTTGAHDAAFYKFTGETLPAYQAYYASAATPASDYIAIGKPTAINNVNADANVNANKAQGIIKTANYIIKDGKKYNYAGQLMK